jgi:hypothetical protein
MMLVFRKPSLQIRPRGGAAMALLPYFLNLM